MSSPLCGPLSSGYTGTIINEEDTGVLAQMGWEDSTFSLDDLLSQNPEQRVTFAKSIYSRLGAFDDTAQGWRKRPWPTLRKTKWA